MWTFGTNQLLTAFGLLITIGIAVGGFRTFGRWKREKIEERRIETALDALALAYESKIVFRSIRGSLSYDFEYKEMPVKAGESQEARSMRGSFWAVGKRVSDNNGFFDRVWKLQPIVMAVFGEQKEEVFGKLHNARALIQVASQTLTWDPPPPTTSDNIQLAAQLRNDLWGGRKESDRVQQELDAFRIDIERVCKPVVDREVRSLNVSWRMPWMAR
jgi:hypothetical protein